MKKTIVVITRSLYAGGAERVIAQLLNYFVQFTNCRLILLDDERILYKLDERIMVESIGRQSNNKVLDKFKRYTRIRKQVKIINPDVVLSMPEDIGIYVLASLAGLKIPVFVSERNNPWVMPDVKITRILRKLVYPTAKGIVFQTEMAKSFFSSKIQGKSRVLLNPVDEKRIPEMYSGIRKKIFVSAGRLDKQKNFKFLIEGFCAFYKNNQDFKLIIYGEGKQREELEKLISDKKMNNVISLPGRDNNLLESIKDCYTFILSSDYEGLPNVLIEAMCMGMPVISTDCPSGGPRTLIRNGENGILIPVGGEKELVAAMNWVTKDNNSEKIGKEAGKIRKSLTDKRIFEQWKEYLGL